MRPPSQRSPSSRLCRSSSTKSSRFRSSYFEEAGQGISIVFAWKVHEGFVVQTPVKIEVVAYSGFKANERPLYFVLERRKLVVVNVMDRWYGEEHDYFKVLADDGKVYLIGWHRLLDSWFVVKILERTGL